MSEYKLKGYVARDNDVDGMGELYFGNEKPTWVEKIDMWTDFGDNLMNLPNDWFPELEYTDEPIEVELTIKKL